MEERKNGFFIFTTVYDTMREIEKVDEQLAFKYIKAVLEYGIYGEYDESDAFINGLMQQTIYGIDSVDNRREKNIGDGSKGGRPRKNKDEDIWKLAADGLSKNEIATQLNCSVRTVERSLSRQN